MSRVLDSRRDLEKAGLRDVRHRLVFCDVQLAGHKVHRILNGPAVGVYQSSKADDPKAE